MLTIRPNCENCDKDLPYDSTEAMICTYECTFCQQCVETTLKNVCPNCGGGFTPRPIRPQVQLMKHPASTERIRKPVSITDHQKLLTRYENILPENR
ncbi:MAG: DUF1272 domain-containing protein [Cyclobacteriaceae bacterium]